MFIFTVFNYAHIGGGGVYTSAMPKEVKVSNPLELGVPNMGAEKQTQVLCKGSTGC